MASLPLSKTGMVLGSRGARACDMCGKEKARWYCAADEAYLCEKCDGCVHSANAVARRHERVKLGPNGAPVKLDRKKKDHAQQQEPCIKKLDVVPCHKWFRAPQRRRTKTRKPSIPKSFLHPTINLEPKAELGVTDPPLFVKEEEEDEEGILLHPATPAAIHGDLPIKCEPASPPLHHDYSSNYDCPSSLTSLQWTSEEANDLALGVPTYEPFLRELIAASHGDLIKEILPTSSPSLGNDGSSTVSAKNASSNNDALEPGLICSKLESTSTPLACDDIEPSCVIEDGSISIDDDEVCHSDMEAFDVMDLCTSAPQDMLDDEEMRADFPDLEMQACSSIFGGNPFKGKGERELEMGSCVKLENFGDDEEEKAMQTGHHDLYHEHPHFQQQYQHNQYYLMQPPAPVIGHPCNMFQKSLCLQLDYEDVLNAWSDRGSLWMDGQRPQTVPDVCFLDPVGSTGGGLLVPVLQDNPTGNNGSVNDQNSSCSNSNNGMMNGNNGGNNGNSNCVNDAEREARVMRYREKRRTRLFSKKIRYEVRKLNAERRPRMKGRFVKRATFNDDV